MTSETQAYYTAVSNSRALAPEEVDLDLERHRPIIRSYIRSRVRTIDDCDDLVQNVFMRASANLQAFRHECPVSHWLLRIALNELRIYYSRVLPKTDMLVSLSEFGEDFSPSVQRTEEVVHPEDSVEMATRLLTAAKTACTSPQFRVIAMFYRGETLERIANLLEMKPTNVRTHFLRGRANLIAYLVQREPDLLGGLDSIKAAAAKAGISENHGERMNGKEREAFENAKTGKVFRAACLKVARFLTLPTMIVWLLEVL